MTGRERGMAWRSGRAAAVAAAPPPPADTGPATAPAASVVDEAAGTALGPGDLVVVWIEDGLLTITRGEGERDLFRAREGTLAGAYCFGELHTGALPDPLTATVVDPEEARSGAVVSSRLPVSDDGRYLFADVPGPDETDYVPGTEPEMGESGTTSTASAPSTDWSTCVPIACRVPTGPSSSPTRSSWAGATRAPRWWGSSARASSPPTTGW